MAANTAPTATELRPIKAIAREIRLYWKNVYFGAKPYLSAMMELNTVNDQYGSESGDMIVRYFLGNATTFKGDDAKRLKAELKAHLN